MIFSLLSAYSQVKISFSPCHDYTMAKLKWTRMPILAIYCPCNLKTNSMNKNNEFYQLIDSYHDLVAEEHKSIANKDELFCECFCVSYNDIVELCPTQDSFDKDLIQQKLNVGLGCGQCFKRIDKLSVDLYISSKEN
jgi:hypothetical protein